MLVNEDITVKATGERIREVDRVHLWTLDESGLIVRHRARLDTHAHWAAYHAG